MGFEVLKASDQSFTVNMGTMAIPEVIPDSSFDIFIEKGVADIKSDVASIRGYVFYRDHSIISVDLPFVTALEQNTFMHCVNLKSVNMPMLENIVGSNNFASCSSLEIVDLPKTITIAKSTFQNCSALQNLVLRSNSVVSLENVSAFSSTPISSGTGYIYVPASLVNSYMNATNWSTYSERIRPLQVFTVDGTVTGELDMSKI